MKEQELSFLISTGQSNLKNVFNGSSIVLNEQSGTDPVYGIINGQKFRLRLGQPIKMEFSKVEYETTENQTINVRYGLEGGQVSGAQSTSVSVSSGSVEISGGLVRGKTASDLFGTLEDIDVLPGATITILPADATRTFHYLIRVDSVTGKVRVGDSNVSATRGSPVAKDGGDVGDCPGAIWCHNPLASTVTFSRRIEVS